MGILHLPLEVARRFAMEEASEQRRRHTASVDIPQHGIGHRYDIFRALIKSRKSWTYSIRLATALEGSMGTFDDCPHYIAKLLLPLDSGNVRGRDVPPYGTGDA